MMQARDIPLASGQFRFVRTDTAVLRHTERCAYRQYDTDEIWIPADPEAEWLLRQDIGRVEWLNGEDPDSTTLPRAFRREFRARYGTFDQDNGPEPSWYHLTPEFLAGLPRDPLALYSLIEQEYARGTASPSKAYFQHAHQLLISAALPADLRTALYQAMAHIQGVEFSEGVTVGSRSGTAIGLITAKGAYEEIVIDPEDGSPIGWRWLAPDGSLTGTTVISGGITEKLGAAPALRE